MISLSLTNSPIGRGYYEIWHLQLFGTKIVEWINDGLMAIFFLMIGLELEREFYHGELSNIKEALFPTIAAIGGMFVPALIYFSLNINSNAIYGSGIPMATDIAFSLGILSLLGNRVPISLKIFLTALAIIDDLGAILVIAIFYSKMIVWYNLGIAMLILLVLFFLNRRKYNRLLPYIIGGVAIWYFMRQSGIHPAIAGVLLAFVIPYHEKPVKSISYLLQQSLYRPVSFFILPLFALCNTAIYLNTDFSGVITSKISLGIFLGLVFGKPIGVSLFSFIAHKLGWCRLPKGLTWTMIIGIGCLAGIGFTMSIFISLLAFDIEKNIIGAKIVILLSSTIASLIGYGVLKYELSRKIG
jgi:NhaA family Na+:H+ antiporter